MVVIMKYRVVVKKNSKTYQPYQVFDDEKDIKYHWEFSLGEIVDIIRIYGHYYIQIRSGG